MLYPKYIKARARQMAEVDDLSAEQIADIFSKEVQQGKHDFVPTARTIRNWLKKSDRTEDEKPVGFGKDPLVVIAREEHTAEIIKHDREVFKKSDEILNEDRLDTLISRLLIGNRYYFEEIVMLFRCASFFEKESNKYVIPKLQQQCVSCCKMIDRLSHFMEIHSYYLEVKDDELGMKYKLIAGGDYDRFYNDLIDGQIQKVERIFSNKADRLASECRDAYKEYRSTVRETLYL